jgi:hypothetical protein
MTPDPEPLTPLRPIANICASGFCPTVYQTQRGTLVIQGSAVTPEQVGVDMPVGESLVEIPRALLIEALRNLG